VGPFCQPNELKDVRIPDQASDVGGGAHGLLPGALDHGLFIGGKSGTLVEQRTDLALELPFRPSALNTLVLVEGTLPRVFHAEQFDHMRPREV
jgi:hypothetical protein